MVVDTADTVVVGDVTYVSNTEIRVDFTAAFAGFAYLT
jgi:FKBP-type peptidyl-prolyl cis-trans isomerase 2